MRRDWPGSTAGYLSPKHEKIFTCLNVIRGILSFSQFVLVVLTAFLMIALSLAVPWITAMSID
jgi:hypothetical protein